MVLKILFACLLVFFSLASPSPAIAKKEEGVTLGLTQSRVKETLKETGKASFQHPVSLEKKSMFEILQSLHYSNYVREFERWEYKKPVFEKEEAERLSALLIKALEKAASNQMVYFSIGKNHEKTKGNVFSADQKLYLHFLSIKGKVQEQEVAYKEFHQWKLIPQTGQKNLETEGILGIKGIHTDWIVTDPLGMISLPANGGAVVPGASESPQKEETKPSQKKIGEIETKLRFLKEMLSEGLITREDYENKKEELLKGIKP